MKFLEKKPVFFTIIAVLFFAILMIVFREFAFDSNRLMLNSDQLNGIGSRILRAQNIVLTEWDDSRLGGVPTIDALFADAYHPLVWTQFIMDPARAVGFKFILTIWVAFMSAMLLAWNLTGNKWWGALLGFLYAFSPEFFTYIYGGHDGKMMVFAIAPLALLAIRKIVRESSIFYVVVLALSITWMILGSHLQLTYMFLWGAGLYTLYEAAFHCDGLKTHSKRIGLASIALAFGLALSSFQVIPPYLYTTTQSVRGEQSHTNYGHAASWSLHQEEMMQMLIPGFIGVDVYEQDEKTNNLKSSSFVNISMPEYRNMAESGLQGSPFYWGHNSFKLDHNNAGALLTFLGFLCFFLPGKRRWACFWGLGAVIALSYGMGAHSPLFKLWYNILPGVKNFRAPGMALFWLPLLLVMMACPVLKTISDKTFFAKNSRALLHGTAMFIILLTLVIIARNFWTLFTGPFGLIVSVLFAFACLGIMSIDDQGKTFSIDNFIDAFKNKLPQTHRAIQVSVLLGFTFVGLFLASGQNFLNDPVMAPYFKPINEIAMNMTASKTIASFVVILFVITVSWLVFKWKGNIAAKATILAIIAGFELYTIDAAFVQNVNAADYLQPKNSIANTLKAPYKADSINTPRVLSLSRNSALTGNIFPQYGMRNAGGIHDNELASYRLFRGDQQNANFLMNINDPSAPHPFLDLMNINAIIFDSQQGTTFFPNKTAMGEAYIYGESVTQNEEESIASLKNGFNYKEKVILSEIPEHKGEGGIAKGFAKLIESPKMDTQVFKVESDRAGFMVVAGNYHPYWKAYVNGVPAKVYKAFGTLRAVEIPKGTSEVRMEYRSTPFHTCVKISLVAAILLIALSICAIVKRKRI